ncbi:hypothetical protein MKX03_013269 [Papaver bracteatum]|nr:hypothetical protein MKX03_013269 [Papaver bracteatum]
MLCLSFYQLRTTYIFEFDASRKWVSEFDLSENTTAELIELIPRIYWIVCLFRPSKFIYVSTFNGLFIDTTISQCF